MSPPPSLVPSPYKSIPTSMEVGMEIETGYEATPFPMQAYHTLVYMCLLHYAPALALVVMMHMGVVYWSSMLPKH